MASQVVVTDDTDGSPDAVTVPFSLGTEFFEIDLSPDNLATLRKELKIYIDHARRLKAPAGAGAPAGRPGKTPAERQELREWATARGYKLNGRGRVPRNVEAEYDAWKLTQNA